MITLAKIYRSLEKDLKIVEQGMESSLNIDLPLLHDASTHYLKAGGKRIRPIFALLAGQFGDYDIAELSKTAIAIELIHMATLVHDDVIDNADLRRGWKTVKSKWDNKIAMYTGDYILAKALMVITEIKNPKVHRILSKGITEMVTGEIVQIQDFFRLDIDLRTYLRRIKRKTALLIAISCQLGAITSNASEHIERQLFRYGYYVGMAFQITDDILDYVGTEKELGKPAGGDLKQGNITLPAIYALQHAPERDTLKKWINKDNIDQYLPKIIEIIKHSDGIEYSKEISKRYIEKAKAQLFDLPAVKTRDNLFEIANFIGKRSY